MKLSRVIYLHGGWECFGIVAEQHFTEVTPPPPIPPMQEQTWLKSHSQGRCSGRCGSHRAHVFEWIYD